MTPKEKAIELVGKFGNIEDFGMSSNEYGYVTWKMSKWKIQCKACALIAVDEILNEYWLHDTKRRDWWIQVKEEIKLR